VARRQGYIGLFRNRYRDVPYLHLDTGYFFSDQVNFSTNRLTEYAAVGNEWVMRAYDLMALDAVNISYRDLRQLAECFSASEYKKRAAKEPVITRFVSANVKAARKGCVSPQPYVIRELSGGRLKDKKIRVGIVGLTEKGFYSSSEFVIEDPFAAARRILPQVRSRSDLVLVMAYMQPDMAERLAQENPQIDVILVDPGRPILKQPRSIGNAVVVHTVYQTTMLGELRLYPTEKGERRRFINRYVELDEVIPDDVAVERLRVEARKEIAAVQQRLFRQRQAGSSSRTPPSVTRSSGVSYVGSAVCRNCHRSAYDVWMQSNHARAYATLQKVKRENDPECLDCHVTGFGRPTGFVSMFSTSRLKDVQCESCHGPGSLHAAHPAPGYGRLATPAGCTFCHTRERSPNFEMSSYWARIKH